MSDKLLSKRIVGRLTARPLTDKETGLVAGGDYIPHMIVRTHCGAGIHDDEIDLDDI